MIDRAIVAYAILGRDIIDFLDYIKELNETELKMLMAMLVLPTRETEPGTSSELNSIGAQLLGPHMESRGIKISSFEV